ncbi:hypothetical protein B0T22DRAFT_182768 [Podospora appendiculata]|uniref:Uncharacterized protein n=1 Tax=Podospora appendiculata TaxID=314037 RepID=A0AAE1CDV7_9PEZI|nr:hypothetical protein B0T22DRAFT_182768 [Podospora appendiculata]
MEIDADTIISPENYETYPGTPRRQASRREVQDLLDRGFMTQEKVHGRLTESLIDTLLIGREGGAAELSRIRAVFQHLRGTTSTCVSEEKFSRFLADAFPPLSDTNLSKGVAALFDIFSWNAAFPFPPASPDTPMLDEDGFIRAVVLLGVDPRSRHLVNFAFGCCHGVSSGHWGPHYGWLVSKRGKTAQDFRRHLFRSLSEPLPGTAMQGEDIPMTTIAVPRFGYYQPRETASRGPLKDDREDNGEDIEDDDEQQVVVMVEEDERSIDVRDVLSECPAEQDSLTAKPLRESYDIALEHLPRQPHDLFMLGVPVPKLVQLFTVLDLVGRFPAPKTLIDSLAAKATPGRGGNDAFVDWHSFDTLLVHVSKDVAQSLSNIFSVFKGVEARS